MNWLRHTFGGDGTAWAWVDGPLMRFISCSTYAMCAVMALAGAVVGRWELVAICAALAYGMSRIGR